MKITHRVRINVVDSKGETTEVLKGAITKIPRKLIHLLFGDAAQVFIMKPGKTVKSVTVQEVDKLDDDTDDRSSGRTGGEPESHGN